MTNLKRKQEESEQRRSRPRRRKRSSSAPLMHDSDSAEKRQALKRLFGRLCSVELESHDFDDDGNEENEDPLLEAVPVDMDPEQLGFLVCAQETLRFLRGRGLPPHHPIFTRLRSRLLQGIGEMGAA